MIVLSFGMAVAFPLSRDSSKPRVYMDMKHRFITGSAILTFALAGAFSISALAQAPTTPAPTTQGPTTEDGPGPTEQPSAPMEIGTPQSPQGTTQQDQTQAPPSDQPPADTQDAQPTEAQPGGPSGEAPAATDRGVGRISMIHGDVSTQRGDSGDWSAATLNQPMMAGDKLSTGDGGRAEVQLDFANILRLGANSKANIANFTHKEIQIQLGRGIANYTVMQNSDAEPEIDTPNVAVHPAHRDGVFRIEVQPDGDSLIIVRKGEAQIATPQGSAEVHTGEMATIRGDSASAQYKISPAPDRDDWDRWNSDRDHMIENAQSWRHTNRYYTGSQDLDAYGSWKNAPDYGDVWVPNEPDGWVPYRNGNWTYEPYYGWTWVGYEPWGWAPYHYGRWFPYGNSWAWWPGPRLGGYRPFWSPAYVSFWGWGAGFGFGLGWGGWGGLGWLPLGPGDWFHPWWGGYGGRFGWVGGRGGWGGRWGGIAPLRAGERFSNVANLHNGRIGGALSTVGAGRFGTGRVTAMGATRAQLGGARMMAGNLPVVPSRASLSASGRAAAPSTMRAGGSERFYGSHNNVARTSFQQETSHLQQSMAQNHVNGFAAGGGRANGNESASRGFSGSGSGSMGKPSAGTAGGREGSGREMGNSSGRSFSNSGSTARSFTPPNSGNPRSAEGSERGFGNNNSNFNAANRGGNEIASRDGFHSFGSAGNGSSGNEASRGGSSYSSGERGGSGSYWNRTAPGSSESRGMNSSSRESYSGRSSAENFGRGSSSSESQRAQASRGESSRGSYGGNYSRPQLDMRQPIARSPYGSSRSYGGYGGSRAPSYGGGRSSGHVSAPSGGHSSGGHSFGGGGGHSSGGGHSGGGHSGGGGHGGHR